MPMIIAGLVAAGMGGFSGFMGGKAEDKKAASMNRRLWRAIKRTQNIQNRSYGQQEAMSRKATSERLAGYDTARKEASRLGRGAKRTAIDRETQGYGRISQNLASRGLGSTTVGANLQRGLASDTTRQLSDIDEGLAGLFGNLALGRSETQAGGTQALSDINTARYNMETELAQRGPLGGATLGNYQVQPRGAGALVGGLQGAAGGLGMALGGMGGGGMGGMGGMGGINPQMMQWLFSGQGGGGGFNPMAGQGMNMNTFAGY
jgi:hypothetical protein